MGFGTHKWICSCIIFLLHGSYCHRPSGLDWLQSKINSWDPWVHDQSRKERAGKRRLQRGGICVSTIHLISTKKSIGFDISRREEMKRYTHLCCRVLPLLLTKYTMSTSRKLQLYTTCTKVFLVFFFFNVVVIIF